MADPSACGKKYLIAPSVSWFILVDKIIGMNDKRFNSIEVHTNNQFVLDRAAIVLKIIVRRVSR
jgi:hypothetical protein